MIGEQRRMQSPFVQAVSTDYATPYGNSKLNRSVDYPAYAVRNISCFINRLRIEREARGLVTPQPAAQMAKGKRRTSESSAIRSPTMRRSEHCLRTSAKQPCAKQAIGGLFPEGTAP